MASDEWRVASGEWRERMKIGCEFEDASPNALLQDYLSPPTPKLSPLLPSSLPLTTRHSIQLSMGVKGMRSPEPPRGKGEVRFAAGAVAGSEVVADEP